MKSPMLWDPLAENDSPADKTGLKSGSRALEAESFAKSDTFKGQGWEKFQKMSAKMTHFLDISQASEMVTNRLKNPFL